MKTAFLAMAIVIASGLVLVLGHFALIEIGRDVATLRTPLPDGSWQQTRLWIVEDEDGLVLHSAGAAWQKRFEGDPVVEIERGGETRRYRARAVPGPHPEIDRLLREKYGLADRWVRFLAACGPDTLPVRLELLQ